MPKGQGKKKMTTSNNKVENKVDGKAINPADVEADKAKAREAAHAKEWASIMSRMAERGINRAAYKECEFAARKIASIVGKRNLTDRAHDNISKALVDTILACMAMLEAFNGNTTLAGNPYKPNDADGVCQFVLNMAAGKIKQTK